eukprot:gnl/MRDRNA2_/MRDRNA2_53544_c0_seq1.p1 gnl/MRDRNA2_/MRDRNA2_53544_c0~~gnl/MRDRNA2_/MRDRNA2_53544_c0_seq1.p1  ORF type:complete len:301 (-),score=48.59 gnl/MRDRNA2_/MRDRNA2_53544_c0_seq1:4-867(-)
MENLKNNPLFGLASDDPDGRQAAVEMGRMACAAVKRLNHAIGEGACRFVELHSGPSRKPSGGTVCSSASSLAASLKELLALDWQGAQLVLEHCDAWTGLTKEKAFLTIEEEIEALNIVNACCTASVSTECTKRRKIEDANRPQVLLAINWARSVLETHSPVTAVEHIKAASDAGVLGGLMFSGCSGEDTPYGKWKDSHMPHGPSASTEDGVHYFAEGSLLRAAEIRACLAAAGCTTRDLAYVGAKITAKHAAKDDVVTRVGLNRDMIALIDTAFNALREEMPAATSG